MRGNKSCSILLGAFSAIAFAACTQQTPSTFRPGPVVLSKAPVDEHTETKTVEKRQDVVSTEEYQEPVTHTKTVTKQVPVTHSRTEEYQEPVTHTKTVMETVQVSKNVEKTINRPVDLLLVVDNSSSMEPSQEKLRRALRGFAATYLKSSYDIRIGVITTDTYLANPAFSDYWARPVPGSTQKFPPNGLKYNDVHPVVGPLYAKLKPGIHDGPVPTFCSELNPDFFFGPSRCGIRDSMKNQGPDHCLNPAAGESSLTECVNTKKNDSIHSGAPILSTLGSDPEQLVRNFIINVSVGTSGSGSERGLESVAQFLRDNETDPDSRLFRKGSLKIIAFLSDENDQSMVIPENPGSGFGPYSGYSNKCPVTKTADGIAYTLSTCVADPNSLVPVSTYKAQLDSFFQALDGTTANYMVAPIVTKLGRTAVKLQNLQHQMHAYGNSHHTIDQDIGSRYIELADLVGNGSMSFDIGVSDYTPVLAAMFQKVTETKVENVQRPKQVSETVMEKRTRQVPETVMEDRTEEVPETVMEKRTRQVTKTIMVPQQVQETKRNVSDTIQLDRTPYGPSAVALQIRHADGSTETLRADQYTVSGKTVKIVDPDLLKRLGPQDQVDLVYSPKMVKEN